MGFSPAFQKIRLGMRRHSGPFPLLSAYWLTASKKDIPNFRVRLMKEKAQRLSGPREIAGAFAGAAHWYGFALWRQIFTLLCRHGRAVKSSCGMGIGHQLLELVAFNLLWQVSPRVWYRYRLYGKPSRHHFHHLIFGHDLPCFHDLSNRGTPGAKQSRHRIDNKSSFMDLVSASGLPGIASLDVIRTPDGLTRLFDAKLPVFCKPAMMSGGIGCARLERQAESWRLVPLNGPAVTGRPAIISYLTLFFGSGPLIVQPVLKDHPALATLSGNTSRLTTLRVITGRFRGGSIAPLFARLEHPLSHGSAIRSHPLRLDKTRLDSGTATLFPKIEQMIDQALSMCCQLHRDHLALRSVAFDLTLTAQGPCFIEANYNWNPEILYRADLACGSDSPGERWLAQCTREL